VLSAKTFLVKRLAAHFAARDWGSQEGSVGGEGSENVKKKDLIIYSIPVGPLGGLPKKPERGIKVGSRRSKDLRRTK